MLSTRTRLLALGAFLSFSAVGAALVSQYYFDMMPCAWCVFQRFIYIVLGAVCLIGLIGRPRLVASIGSVVAALGILAGWYQYTVAAHLESCDQTFADRFMVASGLDGAVPSLFGIFGTCAEARVDLFGIEYALWSIGLFVILLAMMLTAVFRKQSA